jgi:hypothetical protein
MKGEIEGARQTSSRAPACRINAAFRLVSERRLDAATKSFVVRRAVDYFDFAACARPVSRVKQWLIGTGR